MSNEFDDVRNVWKSVTTENPKGPQSAREIILQAKSKKRSMLYFQYGNIIVLTAVLFMICFFFYSFFPLPERLGRIGIGLMVGGLLVRILIEAMSVVTSAKIRYGDHALKNLASTIEYYRLRKLINGPVTVSLVVVYVIGFFMLTPEFSTYISVRWLIVFDVSFVIIATVLIWQIGKGVKKEMRNLEEMVNLHRELERPQHP